MPPETTNYPNPPFFGHPGQTNHPGPHPNPVFFPEPSNFLILGLLVIVMIVSLVVRRIQRK